MHALGRGAFHHLEHIALALALAKEDRSASPPFYMYF